jgi:hypothetical protein
MNKFYKINGKVVIYHFIDKACKAASHIVSKAFSISSKIIEVNFLVSFAIFSLYD